MSEGRVLSGPRCISARRRRLHTADLDAPFARLAGCASDRTCCGPTSLP